MLKNDNACHVCFKEAFNTCQDCNNLVCNEHFDIDDNLCIICSCESFDSSEWKKLLKEFQESSKDCYEKEWAEINFSLVNEEDVKYLITINDNMAMLFYLFLKTDKNTHDLTAMCLHSLKLLKNLQNLQEKTHARYIKHIILSGRHDLQSFEKYLQSKICQELKISNFTLLKEWNKCRKLFFPTYTKNE